MTAENGKKLLFSIAFIIIVILLNRLLKLVLNAITNEKVERLQCWSRQVIRLLTAAVLIVGAVMLDRKPSARPAVVRFTKHRLPIDLT